MKKRKGFLIIFFGILLLICFMFFQFLEKNSEEKRNKNREKNVQKSEAENEKNQIDLEAGFAEERAEDIYENFTREKERYTQKEVIYKKDRKMISLDSTEICKEIGCDPYTLKEYLTAYALEQMLSCDSGKILNYCYASLPDVSRRIYIFIQLDDAEQTLVTAIYEAPTMDAGSHYDVLPCQYSREEIEEQAWYEKEEQ